MEDLEADTWRLEASWGNLSKFAVHDKAAKTQAFDREDNAWQ